VQYNRFDSEYQRQWGWIAIRFDPDLKASFEILSHKMQKNKAIVRIARKLLNRIRTVLIHQKPYKIATN